MSRMVDCLREATTDGAFAMTPRQAATAYRLVQRAPATAGQAPDRAPWVAPALVAAMWLAAAAPLPARADFFDDARRTFKSDIPRFFQQDVPHFFQDDIPCAFGG